MSFLRTFDLARGGIDLKTGEFEATLFTDGEASDGHILSIAGASVPERMPLFVNHAADPTTQLGSLVNPQKSDHAIRQTGVIEVDGDSPLGDIRRDVALMISRGHVQRMSGRWDAAQEDVAARTSLDPDHYAFASAKSAKRNGLFFKRWTALEGSIVGLGADPAAVIGRATDTGIPEHLRQFWRAFGEEQQATPDNTASIAAAVSAVRLASQEARAAGAADADLFHALEDIDTDGFAPFDFEGRTLLLPEALVERLRAPAPAPQAAQPPTPQGIAPKDLEHALVGLAERLRNELREEASRFLYEKLGMVVK